MCLRPFGAFIINWPFSNHSSLYWAIRIYLIFVNRKAGVGEKCALRCGLSAITTLYTLPKYRTSQGVQRGQTQDIRLLRSCNALSCDVNYTTNPLINSHTNWPKLCHLYGLHNFREEHKETLRQADQNTQQEWPWN